MLGFLSKERDESGVMNSRQQIYRFDALVVLALLPFVGMFLLPLVAYGGRLRVRLVDGGSISITELPSDLIAFSLGVFGIWLSVAVVSAWIGVRFFRCRPAVTWVGPELRVAAFFFFFLFGNIFLIVHSLLRFPSSVENIIHLLSLSAGVTIVLGVALVAERHTHARRVVRCVGFLTGVQYVAMLGISLAFGKAMGAVMTFVLMTGALWAVPLKSRTRRIGVVVLVVMTCTALVLKTPIRSISGGRVVDRISVFGAPTEKASPDGMVSGVFAGDDPSLVDMLETDAFDFAGFDQNSDLFVVSSSVLPSVVNHALRRTVHRLNHLGILCVVVSRTPDSVPYWGGSAYMPVLLSLIPRLIYPEKPKNSIANEFGRRYSIIYESDRITSINVNPVTQAWMSGGMLVVVVSGFGMGLLFGLIYGWLTRGGEQWTRLLVYAASLSSVASLESETGLAIGGLLQALTIAFAFICLCRLLVLAPGKSWQA